MGMAHGLETLLAAATELKHTAPQVFFLLVGDGAEKEHIAARAHSLGLINLQIIDAQPREKIPVIYLRVRCLFGLTETDTSF